MQRHRTLLKMSLLAFLGSISALAAPYIQGTYQDDVGKYDNVKIKEIVESAIVICTNMFKSDFIAEHWVYKPRNDEVYVTGRTRGFFNDSFKWFVQNADCSFRPGNQSAAGSKFPRGLNMMGKYEKFSVTPQNK